MKFFKIVCIIIYAISLIILCFVFSYNFSPQYILIAQVAAMKEILNPLSEFPNWIPAPIPFYKPPEYFPYVKVNELLSKCSKSLNNSIPEEPTLINYITNAVVFKNGRVQTDSFYWHHLSAYYMKKRNNIKNFSQIVQFDQAIFFFHPFHTCYYHFIVETFPLLYSLGPKITRKSVLLHQPFMKNLFKQLCKLLGLRFKRVIQVRSPVFVRKLYITNPFFLDGCNPNALRHFRLKMLEKCNAKDLPSTLNVIYNRNRSRFIKNFDVLVNGLKSSLPNYTFIAYTDIQSIVEQVKIWRKCRFAMMIHGSTLANIIFMRPKTAVVEFARNDCRNSFVMLTHVLGMKIYVMMFRNQTRFFSMWVDMSLVIPTVSKIMKMLDSENLTEI